MPTPPPDGCRKTWKTQPPPPQCLPLPLHPRSAPPPPLPPSRPPPLRPHRRPPLFHLRPNSPLVLPAAPSARRLPSILPSFLAPTPERQRLTEETLNKS